MSRSTLKGCFITLYVFGALFLAMGLFVWWVTDSRWSKNEMIPVMIIGSGVLFALGALFHFAAKSPKEKKHKIKTGKKDLKELADIFYDTVNELKLKGETRVGKTLLSEVSKVEFVQGFGEGDQKEFLSAEQHWGILFTVE